jgi:hypothetical protein
MKSGAGKLNSFCTRATAFKKWQNSFVEFIDAGGGLLGVNRRLGD